ncbi:MAG: hypothetical protein AB7F19_04830 [Candidatus Babeliales bacterium]
MILAHWLLFILSAICYALPLLLSSYFWPLVFIFAAPLLYIAVYNNLSFKRGFLWGIITFTLHLAGVITGIDNFAKGSILARLAPALVLISTAAFYAACWFLLNNTIINFFSLRSVGQRLFLWVSTYTLFILFMEHYCFILFGRCEGHFFFNPVLVLAEEPRLLALLPYLGKTILILLLISFSGSLVYLYIRKSLYAFFWVIAFAAPWLISLVIPLAPMIKPAWLKEIAYLPSKLSSQVDLTKQAKLAQELFFHVAVLQPDAKLIIMPESSIFCDHLSKDPDLCAMWSEEDLLRPLHIVLGSFRWDGPSYRNTLHWFFNGKLKEIFDKRHAMLLTEALPEIYNFKLFEKLFFSTYPGITPSTNERPMLHILEGVSFIPYICSELFFNDKPDDRYEKGSTILAITNDIWCKNSNIPKLMCLSARFKAVQWQRNILYISYAYAKYFDTSGNEINLSG